MPAQERDVERLLKEQMRYHLDMAARCRKALEAYQGAQDEGESSSPKTYGWAAAIDEIFNACGDLSVDGVREKLVEMGLPGDNDQNLNTIRSTLSRKAGEGGTLIRVAPGVYKKKVHRNPTINGVPKRNKTWGDVKVPQEWEGDANVNERE